MYTQNIIEKQLKTLKFHFKFYWLMENNWTKIFYFTKIASCESIY